MISFMPAAKTKISELQKLIHQIAREVRAGNLHVTDANEQLNAVKEKMKSTFKQMRAFNC
jgi:predicted  nucleic acid-binding Zn-ribbon protein